MIQEVQFYAMSFMKFAVMIERNWTVITSLTEYFTALESYHLCNNLLLQVSLCKANIRISHTRYKVLPNSNFERFSKFISKCLTVGVFMMQPGEMLVTCFQSVLNQI